MPAALTRDVRRHLGTRRTLHPSQFKVNDAWIAFRLNDAPIQTAHDGAFNCLALMDAASCYILCSDLVPIQSLGLSHEDARRLLQQGRSHEQRMPKTLYVSTKHGSEELCLEAAQENIEVVMVPERDLLVFIGEARETFRERFGKSQ